MNMLLLILILLLLFGGVGYVGNGYRTGTPVAGSNIIVILLVVLLVAAVAGHGYLY